MSKRKLSKVPRISHKRSHGGDSRRAVGVVSKASRQKPESVYSEIKGDFQVFIPVAQTTVSKRQLSSAVNKVVAKMKD